jgi:hypothetical protein
MLAEFNTLPRTHPPGYGFVDGEEKFSAEHHLSLEEPQHVVTLADLGYSSEAISRFPSPIGITSPARVLSEAGITALNRSIELCKAHMVLTRNNESRLYYGGYYSRFMRDLAASKELTSHLSRIFQTPVAPHTMPHLGIQLNTGEKAGTAITSWHHDWVSFTVVLSMYNPFMVEGGRFEYFRGTRDEGRQLAERGKLPDRRIESPLCPAGSAVLAQGSAIFHRAAPLERDGYRASLILSFCARDASYPDANRTYFTKSGYMGTAPGPSPVPAEYARHAAWFTRARLGTIMEELAWTDDLAFISHQLRQAIAPVERVIERLDQGVLSAEESQALRDAEDSNQLATPRFDPGKPHARTVGQPLR